MNRAPIITLAIVAATGCSSYNQSALHGQGEPQVLGDALALLQDDSLLIVAPEGRVGPEGGRRVHRVGLGSDPSWARSVPVPIDNHRRRVLVLQPSQSALHIVEDEQGTHTLVDLGVPLGEMAVSEDGRWGVAFQPEDSPINDALFVFPNTIAVVDLHPAEPEVTALRLGEGGLRPRQIAFSQPLTLMRSVGPVAEPRDVRVALVFTRGGVIPVDLERAAVGPFVPLAPPDEERDVVPTEVLFTNNRGDHIRGELDGVERAFVRTSRGELFVLALQVSPEEGAPVLVSLENVITPVAGVQDIELYFDETGASLLLAAAGENLLLVNGYSGVSESFTAPTGVDRLVAFDDPSSGRSLALAYSANNPAPRLLRVDPLLLSQRRSTGLETIRLGSAVTHIELAEAGRQAMLRYSSRVDIGLLPLQKEGDVLDIRLASEPQAEALTDGGSRLLLVSQHPDEGGTAHLVEVLLDGTFASRNVELDTDASRVGTVGDWVWVQSLYPGLQLTFFPKDNLTSGAAVTFSDLQVARILE